MKVNQSSRYLKFVPSHFVDHPEDLKEVFEFEVNKDQYDFEQAYSLVTIYSNCQCSKGEADPHVGQLTVGESKTFIEVYACGNCQQWGLSCIY